MILKKLSLIGYKNYKEAEFSFDTKINCLIGNNGSGKTNALDAVYYLSFCKSNFNTTDNQNINFGESFFLIQGFYENSLSKEKISCGVKRKHKKQFKRGDKEYHTLAEHIGLIPLVMISPTDTNLITESNEERRRFINQVISQSDQTYLKALIDYNRVLQQRNSLLKQQSGYDSLEIWDEKLILLGRRIYDTRKSFIEKLLPIFHEYYHYISSGKEPVNLEYKSQLNSREFKELLAESLSRDKMLQYTSVGIHRDDLSFSLNNLPLKKIGSQGQQKTFLVALKFAQLDYLKQTSGKMPILILDDIYDRFDSTRVRRIIELISEEKFGQIFISDTSKTRLPQILSEINTSFSCFEIENGEIKIIDEKE